MTGDPHLSIGEVLAHLRDEFPDVTISKIRFLESQGLIGPERTPSGYRKFYARDLARLRWILHQQKEHFLPLKVIKERLDQIPPGEEQLLVFDPAGTADPDELRTVEEAAGATSAPAAAVESGSAGRTSAGARRGRPVRPARPAFAPTLPLEDVDTDDDAPELDDLLTSAQLAEASGLAPAEIAELGSFGLLAPARDAGDDPRYDGDALVVATTVAGFYRRGLEARHLRMYLSFAEREASLFSQVLMPYVRQRNPDARKRLQQELVDLASLGRSLRTALLRRAIGEALAE